MIVYSKITLSKVTSLKIIVLVANFQYAFKIGNLKIFLKSTYLHLQTSLPGKKFTLEFDI